MKTTDLGPRVARARAVAGMTQQALADEVGLERSVVAKIERGVRRVEALELVELGKALGVSLDWLLADALPVVVSGRQGSTIGNTSRHIVHAEVVAVELERDLRMLVDHSSLKAPIQMETRYATSDVSEAERLAREVRNSLRLPREPALDLSRWAERLGLHCIAEDRGEHLPLGLCRSFGAIGIAWINGRSPSGRRRFTLAHELGHHLVQDAYSLDWSESTSEDTERWINTFAIHLLLPRAGVAERWSSLTEHDERARAIILAAEFGVSWSAACAQFGRLELVDSRNVDALRANPPTKGERIELGVQLPEELTPPYVSQEASAAIVKLYRKAKISAARAVEMLRGTLREDELPSLSEIPLDAYLSDLDPLE